MTPKQRSVAIRWAVTTTAAAALINALPLMQLALGASYADVSTGRGLELLLGLFLLVMGSLGVVWLTGSFVAGVGAGTVAMFAWMVAHIAYGLVLLHTYPLGAPYSALYSPARVRGDADFIGLFVFLFVPTLILGALIGTVGAGIGWLGRPVSR